MIVETCKDIVENILKLPFGHGRKAALNLVDGKDDEKGTTDERDTFVWLYPFPEADKPTGGSSLRTTYDIILGFNIVGPLEPGNEKEKEYIARARELAYKFEIELMRDDRVMKVENIKREPFYNFMAENYYGMNIRLSVTARYPTVKC